MKKYNIASINDLTDYVLSKILMDYQGTVLPKLIERRRYYEGEHKILRKRPSDIGRPCNKILVNFIREINEIYAGYALGKPIAYTGDNNFEKILDILKYNDVNELDQQYFKNAAEYGFGAEIYYIDADGQQRIKQLNPETVIPIYDDTLDENLLAVIRFWKVDYSDRMDECYYVEVYDDVYVTKYISNMGFTSFTFVSKDQHFYKQVPITIFPLNDEQEGLCDQVFSLVDCYESLLSDSVDDWDNFCQAYLVIKGMVADEETLNRMKETRCMLIDTDASAEYLTKNTSITEIEHLMTTAEEKIREICACPNMSNETFNASSGIAIQYRLMAMENRVSAILCNMKKALTRRIELLSEILSLTDTDEMWVNSNIEFTRNIPANLNDTAQVINQLRGLVSNQTLLTQLPFIQDVEKEMKLVEAEQSKNYELYQQVNEDDDREVLE